MELKEIERNAKALMTAHGVGRLDFAFDNGKRRIGAMHYTRIGGVCIPQKITLSKHYAVLLGTDEIRDVILHEIAHALAPDDGHGAKWKAMARKVGAKPERCKAASDRPAGRVTAECPECFTPLAEQHRLPQRVYVCRVHHNRALTWKKDGVKVELHQMPQAYQTRMKFAMERGTLR